MFMVCSIVKRIEQTRTSMLNVPQHPARRRLAGGGLDPETSPRVTWERGAEACVRERAGRPPWLRPSPADAMTRKSPSPCGPGLCGVGGEGGGVPITAGGYRQNVLPGFGFRKNLGWECGLGWGAEKRSAPDACRGASPTAAVTGDYLPSPLALYPKSAIRKSAYCASARCRPPSAAGRPARSSSGPWGPFRWRPSPRGAPPRPSTRAIRAA
jgi:hypothetical protein